MLARVRTASLAVIQCGTGDGVQPGALPAAALPVVLAATQAVNLGCRPAYQPATRRWRRHYGTATVPARPGNRPPALELRGVPCIELDDAPAPKKEIACTVLYTNEG